MSGGQTADTTHKQATEVPLFHSGLAYVAAVMHRDAFFFFSPCLIILMVQSYCVYLFSSWRQQKLMC